MILVIAEHQGGQVHRASWEAIAAAQTLLTRIIPVRSSLLDSVA